MYYNAPEMDHMLEPIKMDSDNGYLIAEPIAIIATTILSTNWDQPDNSGDTYNGTLCQHTKWSSRLANHLNAIIESIFVVISVFFGFRFIYIYNLGSELA